MPCQQTMLRKHLIQYALTQVLEAMNFLQA
jgi:hypothetical protein